MINGLLFDIFVLNFFIQTFMRFTKADRLQHPQIKYIPESVWELFFHYELPEEVLPFMQSGEVNKALLSQWSQSVNELEKKEAWLAIVLSHDNLSSDSIYELGQILGLSNEEMFHLTLVWGNASFFNHIKNKINSNRVKEIISENNYQTWVTVIKHGHVHFIEQFNELLGWNSPSPKYTKSWFNNLWDRIKSFASDAFFWIQHLRTKPQQRIKTLSSACSSAFLNVCTYGHMDVLNYIAEKIPHRIKEMISTDIGWAFRYPVLYNKIGVLEFLWEKASVDQINIVFSSYYDALILDTLSGHLEILRFLEKKAPARAKALLEQDDTIGFNHVQWAASAGQLEILRFLEEKVSRTRLQEMIVGGNNRAFKWAAQSGHLEVLKYLEEKASNNLLYMIASGNYESFSSAAENGHLEILKYLEEKAPTNLLDMITARNYESFRFAALRGHLEVLQYLEEKAQTLLQDMLTYNNCEVFRLVNQNNYHITQKCQLDIIKHLITYPSIFSYTEEHVYEYGHHVKPFISETLTALRFERLSHQQNYPHVAFNVSEEKANLLFYMLRNLIRRNEETVQDDIRFLLNLPSLRAMVHIEVTPGNANELLRLAMSINNQFASEILLEIPMVRSLAQQNNYYQQEARGGLDLRVLAQNTESSMTALTQGERKRLEAAQAHYQQALKEFGVTKIIEQLRLRLIERFESSPPILEVIIEGQKRILSLPSNWEAFQALKLQEEEYQQALHAYYQNKYHTAWRFLSKPNPWMHPNASYVVVDPNNPSSRWANFEGYIPFIALLYLAATDTAIGEHDGYTPESRFENFVQELALIGRTHNWDMHPGQVKEQDDLEADKPSCFSGMKRRFFQSVLGHPLFEILTTEMIKQKIRDFVLEQFQASIHEKNRDSIKQALDKLIFGDDVSTKDWETLKQLDISPEKQQIFFDGLKQEYGCQFTEDLSFTRLIKENFAFKKNPDAHIVNFSFLLPTNFFNSKLEAVSSSSSSSMGFFGRPTEEQRNPGTSSEHANKLI